MTYKELLNNLSVMNESQLNSKVMVQSADARYYYATLILPYSIDQGVPIIAVTNGNAICVSGQRQSNGSWN
jgi:hypothetical protein